MSVTIQLDLPESLLSAAQADGLLESAKLGELLTNELRRKKAGRELAATLAGIQSHSGEPLTAEEIQAEITAARRERRVRENRS